MLSIIKLLYIESLFVSHLLFKAILMHQNLKLNIFIPFFHFPIMFSASYSEAQSDHL